MRAVPASRFREGSTRLETYRENRAGRSGPDSRSPGEHSSLAVEGDRGPQERPSGQADFTRVKWRSEKTGKGGARESHDGPAAWFEGFWRKAGRFVRRPAAASQP